MKATRALAFIMLFGLLASAQAQQTVGEDRLNQLAPLAKPQLIKAATAVAFVDDETNWKAASSLRMICAAFDAPLPPQVVEVEGE